MEIPMGNDDIDNFVERGYAVIMQDMVPPIVKTVLREN